MADLKSTFLEVYSILKSELLNDPAFEFSDEATNWIDCIVCRNRWSLLLRYCCRYEDVNGIHSELSFLGSYLRSTAHLEQEKPQVPTSEPLSEPQISAVDADVHMDSGIISFDVDASVKVAESPKATASGTDKEYESQEVLSNLPQEELRLLCSLVAQEGYNVAIKCATITPGMVVESYERCYIHNPPSQSVDHNVSNEDIITGQHTEVHSLETGIITNSGGKQSVINNKATYVDPDGVKSPLEISSTLQMKNLESDSEEDNMFGSNNQAEDTNDPHPVNNDSSFENNASEDVSKKVLFNNDIKENQNSTSEGHLATTSSKPVVDEEMLMKDREIKGMQSKFFCKTGENVPFKHNSLTFGKKGISFDYRKTGDMHLGSMTKARDSFKSDDYVEPDFVIKSVKEG